MNVPPGNLIVGAAFSAVVKLYLVSATCLTRFYFARVNFIARAAVRSNRRFNLESASFVSVRSQ